MPGKEIETKKFEKKKIKANAIISLDACQTIVDDVMFHFLNQLVSCFTLKNK